MSSEKRYGYVRAWAVDRFETIVAMRCQDKQGAPEIRFFFKPEGYGVCEFGLGFVDDGETDAETKIDIVWKELSCQQSIKIIDGWMQTMQTKH